jgi:hypothetical protein
MGRLTRIGNTWTTWGAALTAAAVLAAFWPRAQVDPPVVLLTAIIVDHYETLAIRHVFGRIRAAELATRNLSQRRL